MPKEPTYDLETPTDLVPKNGEHSIERVFFSRVFLDRQIIENTDELTDLSDYKTKDVFSINNGFDVPAEGVRLTTSQTWTAKGLALGQLLHSIGLAPGEVTRIVVLDWNRKTKGELAADTSQRASLDAEIRQKRSISEITDAVANESQHGDSLAKTSASAQQWGVAAGGVAGAGGVVGPAVVGGAAGVGGSYGGSSSKGVATSVSNTDGTRDLAATMMQGISSSTHQHATDARTRRATVVREVSEGETETISTRIIANYNHMHAMTVQYYEVVQIYEVETKVENCERVLFIPLKNIVFTGAMVTRYKDILTRAALIQSARIFLQNYRDQPVWGLDSNLKLYWEGKEFEINKINDELKGLVKEIPEGTDSEGTKKKDLDSVASSKKVALEAITTNMQVQYNEQIATACATFLTDTINGTNKRFHLPGDLKLKEIRVEPYFPEDSLRLKMVEGDDLILKHRDGVYTIDKSINDIREIILEYPKMEKLKDRPLEYSDEDQLPASCRLIVEFQRASSDDDGVVIEYNISLRGMNTPLPVITVMQPTASDTRSIQLLKHLNENSLYYSQAIYSQLPTQYFSQLFGGLKHNDKPLADFVSPEPIAVTGNYVGFVWNFESDEERKEFEQRHMKKGEKDDPDQIPLPSGGVFAEAVLGRFNCAEKIDPDRFWNWQDSPPTFSPPKISPVSTASRAKKQTLAIDKFDGSLLQMQQPQTLPEPSGLTEIIGALKSADLFRDMSGLEKNIDAAKEALVKAADGAGEGAKSAGENLQKIVDLQKSFLANGKLIEGMKPVIEEYAKSISKDNMTEQIAKSKLKDGSSDEPGD